MSPPKSGRGARLRERQAKRIAESEEKRAAMKRERLAQERALGIRTRAPRPIQQKDQ
ncbi:MAG: hypothetical protein RL698_2371 [Pseudomonadota bacterium]|jgi:hypothetical protein